MNEDARILIELQDDDILQTKTKIRIDTANSELVKSAMERAKERWEHWSWDHDFAEEFQNRFSLFFIQWCRFNMGLECECLEEKVGRTW